MDAAAGAVRALGRRAVDASVSFVFWIHGRLFLRRLVLRRPEKVRFITPASAVCVYGTALCVFVKLSKFSNRFFTEHDLLPASFSADTLAHYVNSILLPLIPLFIAIVASRKLEKNANGAPALPFALMFAFSSFCFFTMAFTLGAADQFNYFHLMFFFLMPWLVYISTRRIPRSLFGMWHWPIFSFLFRWF
jgi:hypothetical protein